MTIASTNDALGCSSNAALARVSSGSDLGEERTTVSSQAGSVSRGRQLLENCSPGDHKLSPTLLADAASARRQVVNPRRPEPFTIQLRRLLRPVGSAGELGSNG